MPSWNLSFSAGLGHGWGTVWLRLCHEARGCALPHPHGPSEPVLGLRADPKPGTFGLIKGRGARGTSDAALIHSLSDSLCHGGCTGPVITVMGAGSREMGGHSTASPKPGAPHRPRDHLGASSPSTLEGITRWASRTGRGSQEMVGSHQEGWAGSLCPEDTLHEPSWPAPLQLGALGNKSPRSDSPKQL